MTFVIKHRGKILNLLLILTSLLGYLEWGKGNAEFLFQTEAGILSKVFTDPVSVIHPFTLLPIAGQLLLLWTLFQRVPSKLLTYLGMAGIGVLLVLMFAIGLMSLNPRILASTAPFLVLCFLTIKHHRSSGQDRTKPQNVKH